MTGVREEKTVQNFTINLYDIQPYKQLVKKNADNCTQCIENNIIDVCNAYIKNVLQ